MSAARPTTYWPVRGDQATGPTTRSCAYAGYGSAMKARDDGSKESGTSGGVMVRPSVGAKRGTSCPSGTVSAREMWWLTAQLTHDPVENEATAAGPGRDRPSSWGHRTCCAEVSAQRC